MARRINSKSPKKIIRVFCEGESEQAYTDFIKNCFNDIAVIKYPKATGLFETAKDKFSKDPQFKDYANEIDEVWFFFDVEIKDVAKWTQRHKIIEQIRKLRKKPNIKVRLLMTTGCIEYWLMLHYQMFAPPVQTEAEKEKMLAAVKNKETHYEKGNKEITARIAQNYPTAIENADKIFFYSPRGDRVFGRRTQEKELGLDFYISQVHIYMKLQEKISFLLSLDIE